MANKVFSDEAKYETDYYEFTGNKQREAGLKKERNGINKKQVVIIALAMIAVFSSFFIASSFAAKDKTHFNDELVNDISYTSGYSDGVDGKKFNDSNATDPKYNEGYSDGKLDQK